LQTASPLRELTCHMGSLGVTCHAAEVTFPRLLLPLLYLQIIYQSRVDYILEGSAHLSAHLIKYSQLSAFSIFHCNLNACLFHKSLPL